MPTGLGWSLPPGDPQGAVLRVRLPSHLPPRSRRPAADSRPDRPSLAGTAHFPEDRAAFGELERWKVGELESHCNSLRTREIADTGIYLDEYPLLA